MGFFTSLHFSLLEHVHAMEPQPATAAFPRKPSCCYIADDDDDDDHPHLPTRFDRSLDDMEAGFSRNHRRPLLDLLFRRDSNGSPRRMGGFGSGYLSFGGWMTTRDEDREPHFLDSCCLCKKPLRNNKDIFMYRGDTPFCSEDCRQEQIELDQRRERNMNLSSSVRAAMRNKGQQGRSTSPSESPDPRLHPDTVVVA